MKITKQTENTFKFHILQLNLKIIMTLFKANLGF